MFTRSKSYIEQGYKPVSLSEEDSESKENSESSTRRRSFIRSVSCDNKDLQSTRKLDRSASYENTAHSAEAIMAEENGQPSPDNFDDNQYSIVHTNAAEETSERLMGQMDITQPNDSQEGKRNTCACVKKKTVVWLFFVLSIILHALSLALLVQGNSRDNGQPQSIVDPQKQRGKIISDTAGYRECRLPINYTPYLRGIFEPNLNCAIVDAHSLERGYMMDCDQDSFVPLECLCSMHSNPCGKKKKLREFRCNICNETFLCNNGTVSDKCKTSKKVLGDDCECKKCNCSGTGYTGNHCQLPEELVCSTCNDKKCRNLTNCANSTQYPCQTKYEGLTWNCSKQEIKTQMRKCKEDNQQKSDKIQTPAKYSVSNSSVSESHIKTTRNSWIVFIVETCYLVCLFVIIIIISTCKNRGIKLHQWSSHGLVVGLAGGLVIFIPAVINCITCCTIVTVDLYKVIPYFKGLFILLSCIFLWRHNKEISS